MNEELDGFQIQGNKNVPNGTAVLVLGILSIVMCWKYGILGFVLGIVAIVLHKKDKAIYFTNPSAYEQSFKNSIRVMIDRLTILKNSSLDMSNPNNYIVTVSKQEHCTTFYSVYCACRNKNIKSINLKGMTFAECSKIFYPKVRETVKVGDMENINPKHIQDGGIFYKCVTEQPSVSDEQTCTVQYSCPSTSDFYSIVSNYKYQDVLKEKVFKDPLTKSKDSVSQYQDINTKYINFVKDAIGSCFIPDICEYMIKDLVMMTPEKVIDVFSSHTIQFTSFICYFLYC